MLRLAFDFIITWRETRTRPNAYLRQATGGTSEREHTLPDFLWNYDSPVPSHNQLQDSQCHP